MSHMVGGSVVAGSFDAIFGMALADPNGVGKFVFDTMSDEERDRRTVEYMERQRREFEGRNAWLSERDASFPVEGMSGEFDDGELDVWKTQSSALGTGELIRGDSVHFKQATCKFCDTMQPCLHIEDDWCSIAVCRDCLNKMFDAFGAHPAVTNE